MFSSLILEKIQAGARIRCTTLTVWERLKEAIDNVVDNTTLADLIEEQKNMPDANLM